MASGFDGGGEDLVVRPLMVVLMVLMITQFACRFGLSLLLMLMLMMMMMIPTNDYDCLSMNYSSGAPVFGLLLWPLETFFSLFTTLAHIINNPKSVAAANVRVYRFLSYFQLKPN